MYQNTFKFAGLPITVRSIYEEVQQYCQGYESTEAPAFTVEITEDDINFEREKTCREYACEGLPAPSFTPATLETTAVYRKIADRLPEYNSFVFHGSVIAVDNKAYLFTASSGTGKSTHTRLWRQYLGDRALMVNDDKPIITITPTGPLVHGTPYNGKHRLGNNITVPLKALCVLKRGEENTIRPITKSQAYPILLQQSYRPTDPQAMTRTLSLLDTLAETASLFELHCNMDISAAELAFTTMSMEV